MALYRRRLVEERENLFDAEAIFRQVRQEITPAIVAALRATRKKYALAGDRQSKGGEKVKDPDHTGHKGRVKLILRTAERFGYYLPAPIERPDQQKGETPFIFDERYWYVDGEDEKATGFSFAPEIRPRLWHAYATMRRINEIDPEARPSAIIMADYERFLRADEWIKVWVKAIWNEGLEVVFPETGPVTGMHLDMICAIVRAKSQHLAGYRDRALEVARNAGRIHFGKRPYGLEFTEDKRGVRTHSEEWPVKWEAITRLADGRLHSASDAARWIRRTHGEELAVTQGSIRNWFGIHEAHLHGFYETYRFRCKPCVIKQTNGVLSDFSYTKGRNKRYVRQETPETERLRLPIDHTHYGTPPLTPAVVEAARLRVKQVGRPTTAPQGPATANCIAPARIVRCAICKGRVKETFRDPALVSKVSKWDGWVLICQGAKCRALLQSVTIAEAKTQEPDHKRMVHASLTIPLREALYRWLTQEVAPILYEAPLNEDYAAEKLAIGKRRTELQEKLAQVVTNLAVLDLKAAPAVADAVNAEMRRYQEAIADCDREDQLLSARILRASAANTATWQIRQDFRRGLDKVGTDPAAWRALVEGVVERIEVNLDTWTWVASTHLKVSTLETLKGNLQPDPNNRTSPGCLAGFQFRRVTAVLTGRLLAA